MRLQSNKTNPLFWTSFAICTGLFYLLKFGGDSVVATFYAKEAFNILDIFSQHPGSALPLDYHLGRIQDVLWGPASSLLAGLLLTVFAFKFLKDAKPARFAAAVFVYFLATRPEVLVNPPYRESFTGPFIDVVWLIRHNLDYFGLLQQPSFSQGGPQLYPTSLYPLCVATIMKLIPNLTAFLITMHLLTFAMAAVIVAVLREIARRVFDSQTALLTALIMLALPLNQSMVELINMEMPMLFFAILSVYFLTKNRFAAASACALASLMLKAPGIIACVTVLAASVLRTFDSRKTIHQRILNVSLGISLLILGLIKSIIRSSIIGEQPRNNKVGFLNGLPHTMADTWFWVFLGCAVFFLAHLIFCWFKEEKTTRRLAAFIDGHYTETLMLFMAALWFVLFLNFITVIPRYQFLLAPFLVFLIVFTAVKFIHFPKLYLPLLTCVVLYLFLASHGLWYAGYWAGKPRHPLELERSLEYRNYLQLEKKIVKEIEENYSGFTIGAPLGIAQALTVPEIGYTDKKLNVFMYGNSSPLGIKEFKGLHELDLTKTVWVGFPDCEIIKEVPYPVGENDKVLKEIYSGDLTAYIFMGGFAVERMRLIFEMYQKERLKNNR